MLTLNQPPLTQHISIPKDMSQLSCEAFTAGIVEGVLDGLDVVCYPWRAMKHDLILVSAGKGHRAHSWDRSISPTDCNFDQVGSEGYGSGRGLGEVRTGFLERLGLHYIHAWPTDSTPCSVRPSFLQLGKEGLDILFANRFASFCMDGQHHFESIPVSRSARSIRSKKEGRTSWSGSHGSPQWLVRGAMSSQRGW